jgi:hypothetical protein
MLIGLGEALQWPNQLEAIVGQRGEVVVDGIVSALFCSNPSTERRCEAWRSFWT